MVHDSVREIQEACNHMLEDAHKLDMISLLYSTTKLEEALGKLVSAFDVDKIVDDAEILQLKQECETEAIRLEYCLSINNKKYSKRYQDRCFVDEVCSDYDRSIRHLREKHIVLAVGNYLANHRFIEGVREESKHLLFELEPEVRQLLIVIHSEVIGL